MEIQKLVTVHSTQFPNTPKNTSQYFSHWYIHSTPKREKIKETNNSLKWLEVEE